MGRDSYISVNNGGFGNYPANRVRYDGGSLALPRITRVRDKYPDMSRGHPVIYRVDGGGRDSYIE